MTAVVDVTADATAAGEAVAARIADLIRVTPDAVIGVATGSSPMPVYAALARHVSAGLDASRVTWCALDEYLGLPPRHPQSYRTALEDALIGPLRLDPAALRVPDGTAQDPDQAAEAYERFLAEAGVDLQILGIGRNGHIGFNEPGTSFASRTHRARLTESTRKANARFFSDVASVPHECLTQGVATIMRARSIELIATGEHKAEAVARALYGPVTEQCPASVLQRHPDVRVTLDDAAASLLSRSRTA
ncbi:glucosamine-6-phosphate deaminase [Mycolicibacterium goodii]|uniref:glucosamine-6-phosphate deaminase n=1 Tax=Mycolicibacterium goodii TaxID=134601 RepID=UPI000C268291|nr:glucosamine-6-phosphate deaminase [Mycolicibacterium goodii]PJK19488.1 multidrug transporter [Mycolicibacterium goodii]